MLIIIIIIIIITYKYGYYEVGPCPADKKRWSLRRAQSCSVSFGDEAAVVSQVAGSERANEF